MVAFRPHDDSRHNQSGGLAQLGERLAGSQKVIGSSPLSSTFLNKRPFGEYVEGLSYCGHESYVIERAVQPDDFEDHTFLVVFCRKPFLFQGLRKFKHLAG